jgi:hypothetical protein
MRQHEVEKYARGLLSWSADFAPSHAARRAHLFAERGDSESAAAWLSIQKRIRKLQAARQTVQAPLNSRRS